MIVIIWCIFHHGCIDGILQSLNIALITAAIIVVTLFLFITNDMIFILFIIKNQIIMHGSKTFGAYGLYACRKSLFFNSWHNGDNSSFLDLNNHFKNNIVFIETFYNRLKWFNMKYTKGSSSYITSDASPYTCGESVFVASTHTKVAWYPFFFTCDTFK